MRDRLPRRPWPDRRRRANGTRIRPFRRPHPQDPPHLPRRCRAGRHQGVRPGALFRHLRRQPWKLWHHHTLHTRGPPGVALHGHRRRAQRLQGSTLYQGAVVLLGARAEEAPRDRGRGRRRRLAPTRLRPVRVCHEHRVPHHLRLPHAQGRRRVGAHPGQDQEPLRRRLPRVAQRQFSREHHPLRLVVPHVARGQVRRKSRRLVRAVPRAQGLLRQRVAPV